MGRERGARYDRRWRRYNARTHDLVEPRVRRLGLPAGARLLDVGCGTGLLLARLAPTLPGAFLAGVDRDPAMLTQARSRLPDGAILRASAGALPFAPASFDAAVSSSSLHFWPDPGAGLRELHRILRPGGRLVLLDWSADPLTMRLLERWVRLRDPAHRRIVSGAELAGLLEGAGFTGVRVTRHRSHALWVHALAEARA
jgi:ubiquinone/menaquinone biosynthesis C-methylase UbiE